MAEVGNVVADHSSVNVLYSICCAQLDGVRFGRTLQSRFQDSQLELDRLRVRLPRWAKSVDRANDTRFSVAISAIDDDQIAEAALLFDEMRDNLNALQKASRRYETSHKSQIPEICLADDLSADGQLEHHRASAVARFLQEPTSTMEQASLILYRDTEVDRLLISFTGLLDELDDTFPDSAALRRRLAEQEVKAVKNTPGLQLLMQAAQNADRLIHDIAPRKTFVVRKDISAQDFRAEGYAKQQIGDSLNDLLLSNVDSFTHKGTTWAKGFTATDHSSMQVGSSFGFSDVSRRAPKVATSGGSRAAQPPVSEPASEPAPAGASGRPPGKAPPTKEE